MNHQILLFCHTANQMLLNNWLRKGCDCHTKIDRAKYQNCPYLRSILLCNYFDRVRTRFVICVKALLQISAWALWGSENLVICRTPHILSDTGQHDPFDKPQTIAAAANLPCQLQVCNAHPPCGVFFECLCCQTQDHWLEPHLHPL